MRSVFLAGTIAGTWRDVVADSLRDVHVAVLDPRREDWDSTWSESADDPRFSAQLDWEREAQEKASIVAFYFAPHSDASVSLIELGLLARSGKVIACCPAGFGSKDLVDTACQKYGVPTVADVPALIEAIRSRLS